jgi:hypothetical protein
MIDDSINKSMFPPERISPTFRPLNRSRFASSAAKPTAPAPFDYRLFYLQQKQHGCLDFIFINEKNLIYKFPDHGQGQAARLAHCNALGKGARPTIYRDPFERLVHGRKAYRFHTNNFNLRANCFGSDSVAGDQTAAAYGNQKQIKVTEGLEHL